MFDALWKRKKRTHSPDRSHVGVLSEYTKPHFALPQSLNTSDSTATQPLWQTLRPSAQSFMSDTTDISHHERLYRPSVVRNGVTPPTPNIAGIEIDPPTRGSSHSTQASNIPMTREQTFSPLHPHHRITEKSSTARHETVPFFKTTYGEDSKTAMRTSSVLVDRADPSACNYCIAPPLVGTDTSTMNPNQEGEQITPITSMGGEILHASYPRDQEPEPCPLTPVSLSERYFRSNLYHRTSLRNSVRQNDEMPSQEGFHDCFDAVEALPTPDSTSIDSSTLASLNQEFHKVTSSIHSAVQTTLSVYLPYTEALDHLQKILFDMQKSDTGQEYLAHQRSRVRELLRVVEHPPSASTLLTALRTATEQVEETLLQTQQSLARQRALCFQEANAVFYDQDLG